MIPSIINGKKVTVIGEESFAWRGIHKITLPEGMTIIGKCLYRFTDRNNTIKDVVIPAALFLSLRKHFLINGYYRFTANDVGTFAVAF